MKTTSRRFRFTPNLDFVLKVIQLSDAHVAEYGMTTELYEYAIVTFVNQESVMVKIRAKSSQTTWKTLRNRFKVKMSDHKTK